MIERIRNAIFGDPRTGGVPRSPEWDRVRDEAVADHPYCAVCGYTKNLNAHHIVPFHIDKSKELDKKNLIILGEKCPTGNHHLLFGHLGNWACWNVTVVADAKYWLKKIRERAAMLTRSMMAGFVTPEGVDDA